MDTMRYYRDYMLKKYNTAEGEAQGICQFVDIIGGQWFVDTGQSNDRYIQFAVTPKAGITFNVDKVSFYYSGYGVR